MIHLNIYGPLKIEEEFKYCIGEANKISAMNGEEKLRDILFTKRTTNAFPSLFSVLFIAIHELVVKDSMMITD